MRPHHLPAEIWFHILSHNDPLDNWLALHRTNEYLKDILEHDFSKRCQEAFAVNVSFLFHDSRVYHATEAEFYHYYDIKKSIDFSFERFRSDKRTAVFDYVRISGRADVRLRDKRFLQSWVREQAPALLVKDKGKARTGLANDVSRVPLKIVMGSRRRSNFFSGMDIPIGGMRVDVEKLKIRVRWMPMYAAMLYFTRRKCHRIG